MDVEVDAGDDEVREDVESADTHQDVLILERDLLRHLHHPKDDDQVRAAHVLVAARLQGDCGSLHLRTDSHDENRLLIRLYA